MKRWTIKLLGITLGLILGWIAAGFLPSDTKASQAPDASSAQTGHESAVSGQAPSSHENAHHAGDANLAALVPDASDAPWLMPVLMGVIGLFAAAVAIGIPSLKYQTPVSEPAASHGDHDDHHGQAKAH